MSETIEVKAQQDFWKRLVSGTPIRAVAEIVSNAFDADANSIKIVIKRNALGTVQRVIFTEDGSGIPYTATQHLFSQLGNSWKLKATRSHEKQRLLQGRNGEGRFRALSLGEIVS
ncbi:ATP-binding protein [Mesorhizobium sp. M0134]|uniref:ATP-binding protein n=1 Tax=Mesorhizobium sp. M0134 TaxID=2956889 RepID=UPI00333982FB